MKVTSVDGVEQMLKGSRERIAEGGKKIFYVPTKSECPTLVFIVDGQVQAMRSCKPFVKSYMVVCEQQHNHQTNIILKR